MKLIMAGSVTVFVSDTVAGQPAAGLRLQVYWVEAAADILLRAGTTNAAGTTATPMVSGAKLSAGVYKLVVHAGDYLQATRPDAPRSLDVVPVVFTVDDAAVGRRVAVTLRPDGYDVLCV